MARLTYPDPRKAVRQIERRDAQAAEQYRAELKYHHFRPRVALGMPHSDYYDGTRMLPSLPGAPTWTWPHAQA